MVLLETCGLAEQIHCCDEHLIYESLCLASVNGITTLHDTIVNVSMMAALRSACAMVKV